MAALSLIAFAACEQPTAVLPSARAVPSDVSRTLVGAVSTPIFPTAAPGAFQPAGDARGLNSAGQATGAEFGLTSNQDFLPYRFTPGVGIVAITGCCDTQFGSDINDAGTVVGTAQQGADEGLRGFVAAGTSTTVLSILPGVDPQASARAAAVNNAGTIAGWSDAPGLTRRAVLWSSAGVIQDLGMPGTEAIDINASGQVLLSSVSGAAPFFLWNPGGATQNLNTMLGALTSVVEINDAGQIIGTYTTSGGASHAFLYTPGSGLTDLGTLGGATSAPTGLNNNGQVVGTSLTSGGSAHAFLWTQSEGMEDVTATTGVNGIGRLNDNLQTLSGFQAPTGPVGAFGQPRLVQLQVSHDAAPVARFTWSCAHKKCDFDASTSTDDVGIVSYSWSLDKTPHGTATGISVTAVYPHGGTADVTLTVTDTKGQTNSVTQTITTP